MTGKELKAWAAQIHDEDSVQYNHGLAYENWKPLALDSVRAIHDVRPVRIQDAASELEEATS